MCFSAFLPSYDFNLSAIQLTSTMGTANLLLPRVEAGDPSAGPLSPSGQQRQV